MKDYIIRLGSVDFSVGDLNRMASTAIPTDLGSGQQIKNIGSDSIRKIGADGLYGMPIPSWTASMGADPTWTRYYHLAWKNATISDGNWPNGLTRAILEGPSQSGITISLWKPLVGNAANTPLTPGKVEDINGRRCVCVDTTGPIKLIQPYGGATGRNGPGGARTTYPRRLPPVGPDERAGLRRGELREGRFGQRDLVSGLADGELQHAGPAEHRIQGQRLYDAEQPDRRYDQRVRATVRDELQGARQRPAERRVAGRDDHEEPRAGRAADAGPHERPEPDERVSPARTSSTRGQVRPLPSVRPGGRATVPIPAIRRSSTEGPRTSSTASPSGTHPTTASTTTATGPWTTTTRDCRRATRADPRCASSGVLDLNQIPTEVWAMRLARQPDRAHGQRVRLPALLRA